MRNLILFLSLGGAVFAAENFASKAEAVESAINGKKMVLAARLDNELQAALGEQLKHPRPPYPKAPNSDYAEMVAAVKHALAAGDLLAAYNANSELTFNLYVAAKNLPPAIRLPELEEDLAGLTGVKREMRVAEVGYAALDAGDLVKAAAYGGELVSSATTGWQSGDSVFDGNQILGLVALRQGSVAEAKQRLATAGATKGSPRLNSFGPTFLLAKALVEKGEREAVISFLEACGKFWKMDRGKLAEWTATVRGGGTPSFQSP